MISLTEILTGHCRFHFSKLVIVIKELNRFFALDTETGKHLLTVCPAMVLKRSSTFSK